jgi:hypothetical protein
VDVVNGASAGESVGADLVQALAGAVLVRDRLAESGDSEGTHWALLIVDALNRVIDALGLERPFGTAALVHRSGTMPVPGFTDTSTT